jgi:hypothetical protein
MYRQSLQRAHWPRLLLAASLLLSGLFPPPARAQDRKRKPVVVSFGQPNIWSLEQAHYLLARMHMTNLELQAKALSDTDLDPNATHGTRIQILKQLLGIEASFDQGVGFQNERIVETARFNDTRRRDLTTNRDRMRADSLQLSREISRLESERSLITDGTSDRAKQLDAEIRQKKAERDSINQEVTFHDSEIQKLGAEPSGTPAAATVPTPSSSPRLPSGIIDKLTDEQVKKLFGEGRDPKLNATTMLDNTVQLQYEIIAKQLTLLRDEVGPGERLVFLELPQSVYTTPGPGDEKMAQSWWHVNGYTRTDPLIRALLELFEVEQKWDAIQKVPAYIDRKAKVEAVPCVVGKSPDPTEQAEREKAAQQARKTLEGDSIAEIFFGLRCERLNARETVLGKLYREANNVFHRVEQNGAHDTSEMVEAIRKAVAVSRNVTTPDGEGQSVTTLVETKTTGTERLVTTSTSQSKEDARRAEMDNLKDVLLKILSEDRPLDILSDDKDKLRGLTDEQAQKFRKLKAEFERFNIKKGTEFERSIEFIRLDEESERSPDARDIERRTVRTVDIIPRQSSLNVNDVQSTVKATGILAAFKFLFGFAGQVNFQRQREQFEQFVHQELYASGFGKGNRDFGWTFGALPGTKRVAPGVRTTYAALVVPDDAESIVLSARGCYFPRKSYQPLDFNDTGHSDWADDDKFKRYNCGGEQTYILTIPGGGDTSNFWVTNVDYQDGQKGGEFVTVSVRGNNFSSQMGVLIDGVPLHATVGLAHPHLMPKRAGANGAAPTPSASECPSSVTTICGRYERIDPGQIVFSFRMPTGYVGTPTITLIAPGKSVDLNSILNLRINRTANVSLKDNVVPLMFGRRAGLSITDLQLLSDPSVSTYVKALLTGTGFDAAKDSVYVNGREVTGAAKSFKSQSLYELQFALPADENLKVTVVRDNDVESTTIPNPAALKITSATVLSYTPPAKKKPGVMLVKIVGAGFTARVIPPYVQGATGRRLVSLSPTEIILRLVGPDPPIVIRLTDSQTGGSVSKVIQSLPAQEEATPKRN